MGQERKFPTPYAAFTAGWEALQRKGCIFDKSMQEAATKYR
jgi:hypothetical protein